MNTETIWQFRTANFRIAYEVFPEYDLDLSWDEDGETRDRLERGLLVAFVAKVAIYWQGREIAADYLGNCIYENAEDFRDHFGGKGSYFSDMVRSAVREARRNLNAVPKVRAA